MKHGLNILTIIGVALLLSSCGIKPDTLEPPQGAENKTFPRTYPDLSSDPRPYSH